MFLKFLQTSSQLNQFLRDNRTSFQNQTELTSGVLNKFGITEITGDINEFLLSAFRYYDYYPLNKLNLFVDVKTKLRTLSLGDFVVIDNEPFIFIDKTSNTTFRTIEFGKRFIENHSLDNIQGIGLKGIFLRLFCREICPS